MKGKIVFEALLIILGLSITNIHSYTPKFFNDTDYVVMIKFPVQAAIDMDYVLVPPQSKFEYKLPAANLSQGIKIPHIMIPYEGMTVKVLNTKEELSDKKTGACGFTYTLRAIVESEPGLIQGTIKPKSVKFELDRKSCGIIGGTTKRSKSYDLAKTPNKFTPIVTIPTN